MSIFFNSLSYPYIPGGTTELPPPHHHHPTALTLDNNPTALHPPTLNHKTQDIVRCGGSGEQRDSFTLTVLLVSKSNTIKNELHKIGKYFAKERTYDNLI